MANSVATWRVLSARVSKSSTTTAVATPSRKKPLSGVDLVRLAQINHALAVQESKAAARAAHARLVYERAQVRIRAKEARAEARARADFERERRAAFTARRLRRAAANPASRPAPKHRSRPRPRPQPPIPTGATPHLT